MKKLIFITASILMLSTASIKAQITFQHTFPVSVGTGQQTIPVIINLGKNEYKYFYVDYFANQIRLFNLDFTNYCTVNVPVTLINSNHYQIGYVTRTLFDCDTSMFEYAIMPSSTFGTFYVYHQDGTLLFQKDSSLAPYYFGIYGAAYDVRPIMNTPNGAVLFLAIPDSSGLVIGENVFSLCDSLPEQINETTLFNKSFVNIFPNPTANTLTFEINPPDNINEYELVIIDNNAKELKREKINKGSNKYTIDVSAFSGGAYFYSLCTKNKAFQTGKFIITK